MADLPNSTDALDVVRARIETMRFSETADWLRSVIAETVVIPGAEWDEPPFAIVKRVYSGLSGVARQVVLDVIISAIKNISPRERSAPTSQAEDNLLLLAADLFASADDQPRQTAIDQLRRIGTGPYPYALQDRALGLLPSLRHRATPDFWKSVGADRPAERASTAIRGLATHDLQLACEWAASDAGRTKALANLLPWLVEEHGGAAVSDSLRGVWQHMDADSKRYITDWAHVLELRVPSSTDPRETLASRLLSWQPGMSPRAALTLLRAGLKSSEGFEYELDRFIKQLALCFLDPEQNQELLALRALSRLFSTIREKLPGRYDEHADVTAAFIQVDQRLNPPWRPSRGHVVRQ